MNKELEALNYLYNDLRLMKHLDIVEEAKVKSAYECLCQALQRLEAIDNTNPSKALKDLHKVASKVELADADDYWEVRNAYTSVEQTLLKAQEKEREEVAKRCMENPTFRIIK